MKMIQELESQAKVLLESESSSSGKGEEWMALAAKWKQVQRLEKEQFALNQAFLSFENSKEKRFYSHAAKALVLLGHSHRSMGHNRLARQAYQSSIQHAKEMGKANNESIAKGYFHLGSLAEQTWNMKIAISNYQKARQCFEVLQDEEARSQIDQKLRSCQVKQNTFKK